jgi:hypothetical protein
MVGVRDRTEDFKEASRVAALSYGYSEVHFFIIFILVHSRQSNLSSFFCEISKLCLHLIVLPEIGPVGCVDDIFHHAQVIAKVDIYKICNQDGTHLPLLKTNEKRKKNEVHILAKRLHILNVTEL